MRLFRISLIWYLIFSSLILGLIPRDGFALFIPSDLQGGYDRKEDLTKIQAFLEKKVVTQRLLDLGLSTEEAYARLKNLSDGQIHELATHIDDIKSGGDGLGVVIALLVIVILVIVILQLSGHKVIITK